MSPIELAAALRDEAEFWLSTPGGNDPASSAYMIGPMLQRLADRIEAST